MATKTVIMFPYSGYKANTTREELFWEIISHCREVADDPAPLVVLNRDTERRDQAQVFLRDRRSKEVTIHRAWSVDSCQMWLAGWGALIDSCPDASRVVQLPGDIDAVADKRGFFASLGVFIALREPWDLVIGDFATGEMFSAKDLIDLYGTYPLLANWFPEISRKIQTLPLYKPRSEFLNMSCTALEGMMSCRKFAYEQTLNMLIRSWDFDRRNWKHRIASHRLGTLHDDRTFRQYRECLDQIERTERMLRLVWREVNEPPPGAPQTTYKEFNDEYDKLDQKSTAIRENARLTIRSLLDQ